MTQNMIHTAATISGAARFYSISRSTVRRYVRLYPSILVEGLIDLEALKKAVAVRKFFDGRGFPIGQKRPQMRLPFDRPESGPRSFRGCTQRIEIIKKQLEQMTDQQQELLIHWMRRDEWKRWFRPKNLAAVTKFFAKLHAAPE